ncbi:MAG: AAA family ATPase [Candidatus Promineofilum sp.]|nr:AAA family ATPase [Promineifilum sp.]
MNTPYTLPVQPDAIPDELKALANWVGWRWAERDGKWTKPPIGVQTGAGAKSNDASTWAPFDAALHSYQNGGRLAGIGVMLAPPFVGVDLDDCRDQKTGALESWAYAIVQRLATYAEVSPTGTGVKLICRGDLPVTGTNKPNGWPVEMYQSGRYFTVTGQRLEGAPADVRDASEAVTWLYNRITNETPPAWVAPSLVADDDSHRRGETPTVPQTPPKPLQAVGGHPGAGLSDADLLRIVGRSEKAAEFGRLWAGNAGDYPGKDGKPDESTADFALLGLLTFYTRDASQLDRIFRQSALYRPKWDERHYSNGDTYGQRTIANILKRDAGKPMHDPTYRSAAPHPAEPPPEEPPDLWPAESVPATQHATAPRFKLYSARDALQPQAPPVWIVDRLLTPGSVSAIVGAPGSKKTYSLLDMAVCVAMGKPWLNLATQQGAVLIIDEESGAARMGRRLGGVLNAHFADESAPVFYTCLAGLKLQQAPEVDALRQLITQTGAALVIIDALADIMPGADENAVKDVQPIMLALRRIADATGAAIVLIHHAGKNGDYRGSSAIKGAVDLMLTVQSEPDEDIVRFAFEKARDVEPFKFAGQSHFSDGLFWLSAIDAEPGKPKLSPSESYVMGYLAEHGPSPLTEMVDNADTCSPDAAKQAVYKLAGRKLIYRTNEGSKGNPAIYALTSDQDAKK